MLHKYCITSALTKQLQIHIWELPKSIYGGILNVSRIDAYERMTDVDIQKIITEALEKLSQNKELRKAFDVDPVKTLEKLFKVDLPDDQVNAVIKAIRAKLDIEDVADVAGKVIGGLGNLFGKN